MTDKQFNYLSIPVLDHKAPTLERLRHAINWIDTQIACGALCGCALRAMRPSGVCGGGHLLSKDPLLSVESVMQKISPRAQYCKAQ